MEPNCALWKRLIGQSTSQKLLFSINSFVSINQNSLSLSFKKERAGGKEKERKKRERGNERVFWESTERNKLKKMQKNMKSGWKCIWKREAKVIVVVRRKINRVGGGKESADAKGSSRSVKRARRASDLDRVLALGANDKTNQAASQRMALVAVASSVHLNLSGSRRFERRIERVARVQTIVSGVNREPTWWPGLRSHFY